MHSGLKNQQNTDGVSTLYHRLHSFIDSGLCSLCNRFDDDSAWSTEFEKPAIAGDNFAAALIRLGRALGHVIHLDTKVITLAFVLLCPDVDLIYRDVHGSVSQIACGLSYSRNFDPRQAKHLG
jgi:hypothetical protein